MWKKSLIVIMCISVSILTPKIVLANNEDDEIVYVQEIIQTCSQCVEEELKIDSKVAVAYDRTSGTVIWGKDENKKSAMASTTKIMTAIVTLEHGNLDDIVTVSSKAAWTGGSSLDLKTGDKVRLEELLIRINVKIRK